MTPLDSSHLFLLQQVMFASAQERQMRLNESVDPPVPCDLSSLDFNSMNRGPSVSVQRPSSFESSNTSNMLAVVLMMKQKHKLKMTQTSLFEQRFMDQQSAQGFELGSIIKKVDVYNSPTRQSRKRPAFAQSVDSPLLSTEGQTMLSTEGQTMLLSPRVCASPAFIEEESRPQQEMKSSKKDSKWLTTLEELKEYKKENGDCVVPRGYALSPRLASWVAEQRKQYKLMKDCKQSSITAERVAMLDELDFAWNAQEAAWDRHMKDLEAFREQNGHCHVPLNHPKYAKLGLWVKEQRRHYTIMKQGKQSHMTQERTEELDSIDFCWDTHEATWLERIRELSEFRERHGSCVVPTSYTENPKLGTWVHHQRRQYKKFKEGKPCHITEERIRALEKLGFVWYPRDKNQSQDTMSSCSDCSDSERDLCVLDLRPRKRQRRN